MVNDSRQILNRALGIDLATLDGKTLQPVEVAVVDSGIDASHPDLAGRVLRQFRVEAPGKDQPPELKPVELGTHNDSYWHGTAVGGIIAGIAPNAKLIDIRVLGANNQATTEALLVGLAQAIEQGARIINLSLAASDSAKPALIELLERAYYRDQIVIAARRNFTIHGDGWPAALSACIGVGTQAFDNARQFHYFRSSPIELFARGEDVTVAVPGAAYSTTFGTSFATPAVSGIAALLLGAEPNLGPVEMKALLKAHALKIQ